MSDIPIYAATIVHHGQGEGDALLREFAHELLAAGHRIRGLITLHTKDPSGAQPMVIASVSDESQQFIISQQLGRASQSCILDAGGLADAAIVLNDALRASPDLILFNRFGFSEAEGKGFASEMLACMSDGIPLLTMTSSKYLPQWQHFTGGLADELPLQKTLWHQWFTRTQAARKH